MHTEGKGDGSADKYQTDRYPSRSIMQSHANPKSACLTVIISMTDHAHTINLSYLCPSMSLITRTIYRRKLCTIDKEGWESSSGVSASSASFMASSVPELRRLDSEFVSPESISNKGSQSHSFHTTEELCIGLRKPTLPR